MSGSEIEKKKKKRKEERKKKNAASSTTINVFLVKEGKISYHEIPNFPGIRFASITTRRW